jgi:hypothetical protein
VRLRASTRDQEPAGRTIRAVDTAEYHGAAAEIRKLDAEVARLRAILLGLGIDPGRS